MDSYEIGKRDKKSFKKGFLYQTRGKDGKFEDEQFRIQRAIEKFEKLLENTPYATQKMIEKVNNKISELRGRQEAFGRGMEAGTFNPEGNINDEYNKYVKELETEQER